MVVGLPPLEFTECMSDSPNFRENLHKHEKELENTSQQIKRIIKEVKDLLNAAKQLSNSQRSFASSLQNFTFECIGESQTDDEQVICKSLSEFGKLINSIEDERDRMHSAYGVVQQSEHSHLDNAYSQVVKPLEDFRKKHIGGVKGEKKKFDKQTAKFCQCQERYLNLTTKKPNSLKEADASVDMAERHFYTASMEYVYQIQKVHERKKFEFVETLLSFLFGWLTFYHQGHEVAKDFRPYMHDLQLKIQKTRSNFDDYSSKLEKRMADVQKQYLDEPVRNTKGRKEGYLFLLEKKAFGTVWTKHYCTYNKETKEFKMIPYNQLTTKSLPPPEVMVISSCVRRMSDSIEKRFCFDLQVDARPGIVYTFQALSEQDRKSWMDIMDGKEPTYTAPGIKPQNAEERVLDDVGIEFVNRCIEVLENRGLEEQGLYRVVGVTSKVNNLLKMGLDRRKTDRLVGMDDPQEWETKTITSALKSYLRNLPEPLMTHKFHNKFITAVKNETWQQRVNDVHALVYRIPKPNFEVLKILIKHLTNVAGKCDKNLMTVSNLGVCFGPTLLRPEEETVASIMDLKFYNVVVEILITYYDKIFNSEPDNLPEKPIHTPVYSPVNSRVLNLVQDSPSNNLHEGEPIDTQYGWGRNRGYNSNNAMSATGVQQTVSYSQQPYTCTVRTYYEPPGPNMSSSLYNVHEPPNGGAHYAMVRSEHGAASNGHHGAPPRLNHQRFTPNVSSQSETNLNSLHSYSPTNFRPYARLDPNSTSSSNESVSSTSRDGNYLTNHVSPEKSKRLNIPVTYAKAYRSPGNVRVRTLYACLGERDGELSFNQNQIITNVQSTLEPGWLKGTLNGKTGLIPENYVEILP